MEKLKLTFLGQNNHQKLSLLEDILHTYGKEICTYAQGFFNYIVTTTLEYNVVKEASLYISVPEIGYDYKVISLIYHDNDTVEVQFYTLKTAQIESDIINVRINPDLLDKKIAALLSTTLANTTFKFLVDQVLMKRNGSKEFFGL